MDDQSNDLEFSIQRFSSVQRSLLSEPIKMCNVFTHGGTLGMQPLI
jgi:hypothetical protein